MRDKHKRTRHIALPKRTQFEAGLEALMSVVDEVEDQSDDEVDESRVRLPFENIDWFMYGQLHNDRDAHVTGGTKNSSQDAFARHHTTRNDDDSDEDGDGGSDDVSDDDDSGSSSDSSMLGHHLNDHNHKSSSRIGAGVKKKVRQLRKRRRRQSRLKKREQRQRKRPQFYVSVMFCDREMFKFFPFYEDELRQLVSAISFFSGLAPLDEHGHQQIIMQYLSMELVETRQRILADLVQEPSPWIKHTKPLFELVTRLTQPESVAQRIRERRRELLQRRERRRQKELEDKRERDIIRERLRAGGNAGIVDRLRLAIARRRDAEADDESSDADDKQKDDGGSVSSASGDEAHHNKNQENNDKKKQKKQKNSQKKKDKKKKKKKQKDDDATDEEHAIKAVDLERLYHSCRLNSEVTRETLSMLQQVWDDAPKDTEEVLLNVLMVVERLLDRSVMNARQSNFRNLLLWLKHLEGTLDPYRNARSLKMVTNLIKAARRIKSYRIGGIGPTQVSQTFGDLDRLRRFRAKFHDNY
eukprot:TRINITY_DN66192_c7_g1_i1.p1 TRINITY_DN66192_c7_g1~~TRINITY_DN66192_c7_g1_i1.p1  ORF type:complete len:607 (+),score=364.69 TRINITY_DN66192_c7_g1_i1:242-1822(+)